MEGNLDAAEPLCRAALQVQPDNVEALHLSGLIAFQHAHFDEAERAFGQALRVNPNAVDALVDRGRALLALNRTSEALASLEAALAIGPATAGELCQQGVALQVLGRHADALVHFEKALAARADHVPAISGVGQLLEALGRSDEALAVYGRAIALLGDSAIIRNDRANALFRAGRIDDAMADWETALALAPQLVVAWMSRGNAFHTLGRSELALGAYDVVSELRPDDPSAPYNRGVVLQAIGRLEEALAAYDWALSIRPNLVDALHNRGNLHSKLNRSREALADFERVLELVPDYPHVAGSIAIERARMCDWRSRDRDVQRVVEGIRLGKPVCVPLVALAVSDQPAIQLACAVDHVADRHPMSGILLWNGEDYRHDRIRVAFLSCDFHDHATSFLIAGMFEQHARERFQYTGLSMGPDVASATRDRIKAGVDRFIDVRGKSGAEIAATVRGLEIDIAVDLMGFTGDSRPDIFARRSAPVQVNFLGYPGTMGAEYIDYIIADRFVIPDELRVHYAEHVVLLPDSFQPNDAMRRIADVTPSRAAVGLPESGFVFCSFNNNYKISPDTFAVWMRLLQRTPGSVLWLFAGNDAVKANLRREAESLGVAPDRLVFASHMLYAEHLARFRLADLFLDTLPFNGGATASDALWAGVPVVSCAGQAFAARMAGSLLHAVGLPELVTYSPEDYEALALQLANDPPRLAAIKQRLARNRETFPLFDTARYCRNIEAAWVTMWEKTQRGERPGSFAVSR